MAPLETGHVFVRNAVYLVLFYLIIGFNYVGETLGCSIQRAFQQNLVFKHVVNFVGLFVFATVTGDRQNPWTALAHTLRPVLSEHPHLLRKHHDILAYRLLHVSHRLA